MKEEDEKYSLEQFRGIPKFIEELNQNIKNIDNKISCNIKEKKNLVNKMSAQQECFDIKNLVKQSVDGLNDILNMKVVKNAFPINAHGSSKNLNPLGFEAIQEELPTKFNKENITEPVGKKIVSGVGIKSHNNSKRVIVSANSINSNRDKNKEIKTTPKNKVIGMSSSNSNDNSNTKSNHKTKNLINNCLNNNNNIPTTSSNRKDSANGIINTTTINSSNSSINNNKVLNKNNQPQSLKERITNANFIKSNSNVSSTETDIVIDKKRNQSVNKRNEKEDKSDKTISPPTKNFTFKPKNKKIEYSEFITTNTIPGNTSPNKKKSLSNNNYLTQLKIPANSEVANKKISNILLQSLPTSELELSIKSSNTTIRNVNKFINSNIEENKEIIHNEFPQEYNVNSFVKLSLLYNEVNKNSIAELQDKLISEDLTKLLESLIEIECNKNENEILPDNPIDNFNEESNSIKILKKSSLYNMENVTKIQRYWRKYLIKKYFNSENEETINMKIKNKIIEDIKKIEKFQEFLHTINSAISLFNKFAVSNKSILTDYFHLSKNDNILPLEQHTIYKNFINQILSSKIIEKSEKTNTLFTKNVIVENFQALNEENERQLTVEKQKHVITNNFLNFKQNVIHQNSNILSRSQQSNKTNERYLDSKVISITVDQEY